jgi:GntR family transcriptional repressor for pyruvate dehydrogenase complex
LGDSIGANDLMISSGNLSYQLTSVNQTFCILSRLNVTISSIPEEISCAPMHRYGFYADKENQLAATAEKAIKKSDWGPQLKRIAISDEVISRFRELIASRVLTPGCQLPTERELGEILGVSRPTLRQAMKGLQLLGIIRSRQGDGSYLAESTRDILRVPMEFAIAFKGMARNDLFEAREAIEMKLAAAAAERRTVEDLKEMRDALAGMLLSKSMSDEYCDSGLRFHNAIATASKNAVMITIIEMLSGMLVQGRRESVRLLNDYDASYLEHEQIFLEIEKQNAKAAGVAMMKHFRSIEARVRQAELAS